MDKDKLEVQVIILFSKGLAQITVNCKDSILLERACRLWRACCALSHGMNGTHSLP